MFWFCRRHVAFPFSLSYRVYKQKKKKKTKHKKEQTLRAIANAFVKY